jgi:hypothetical protein
MKNPSYTNRNDKTLNEEEGATAREAEKKASESKETSKPEEESIPGEVNEPKKENEPKAASDMKKVASEYEKKASEQEKSSDPVNTASILEEANEPEKMTGELKTTNMLEETVHIHEESKAFFKNIHELSLDLKLLTNNLKVLKKESNKKKKETTGSINNDKRKKCKQGSKISHGNEIQQSVKIKRKEKGCLFKWIIGLSWVCVWILLTILLLANCYSSHLIVVSVLSAMVFMTNCKIMKLTLSIKELNISLEKEILKLSDKLTLDNKEIEIRSMSKNLKEVDFLKSIIRKKEKTNEIYKACKSMESLTKSLYNRQTKIINCVEIINKEIKHNKIIISNLEKEIFLLKLNEETERFSKEEDTYKVVKSIEKDSYNSTENIEFVDPNKCIDKELSGNEVSNTKDKYIETNVEEDDIIKLYYQWITLYEKSKKNKEIVTPKLPEKMKYVNVEQNNGVKECSDEDAVVIGFQVDENKWFLLPNPITANSYNITRFYSNYSNNCKITKLCSYNDKHIDAGNYE